MHIHNDIEAFAVKVQAMRMAYYRERFVSTAHFYDFPIEVEFGKKKARLVTVDKGQRQVWGFVDMTNGDILKAAGWNQAAKHTRGNIYNPDPLQGCGPYGPDYLR